MSVEIGATLRAAREEQALPLEELSESTRIRPKVLRALEEGDLDDLGPAFYVRSFVRTYAEALHLDPEPMLAGLGDDPSTDLRAIPGTAATAPPTGTFGRHLTAAMAAVLVVTGLAVVDARTGGSTALPPPAPTVPLADGAADVAEESSHWQRVSPPEVAVVPEVAPVRMELVIAGGESWVRVRSGDAVLVEGIQPDGTVLPLEPEAQLTVRAGNAGVVHLRVGDQEPVPLGLPGEVVDVDLDGAADVPTARPAIAT